ncbi:hypothetical protein [Methanosphaerula subterraneus]|uniref:hypothetical protein n=1 Tax=Methanosphaerula subterraneus TaxID=3350244 RepID=UPI003F85A59A
MHRPDRNLDIDAKTVGQVVARAETSAGNTASITIHHRIGRDLDCDGWRPVP